MTRATFLLICSLMSATAAERLLWRDPGPIEGLDMAAGPGGRRNAPQPPFRFVQEEKGGTAPKVVVSDSAGRKWMVKFGEEAKPDTFASRIAWAAGFPVRPSYYVADGSIEGVHSLERAAMHISGNGEFRGARFQMFDTEAFHELPGGKLDLNEKSGDPRELNALKLTCLLVANWDVKPANRGVFEIEGKQYAALTDWGASMGDPAAVNAADRKWNCAEYSKRTESLIDGVDAGYVSFNYTQYAARHEHELAAGIRVQDMKWFMERMGKLSNTQLRAALAASGATPEETNCFSTAMRKRLDMFAAATEEGPRVIRSRTVTKTTTKTVPK